jgi:hypothetical protein
LLLATDLGRSTDNRSQAVNSELERQLQETLRREAETDAGNRGLQNLLATANTAPAPDKLQSDIARLQTELAGEKKRHAGLAEQLAASKSTLEERDKLLGITGVRENIQKNAEELEVLARADATVRAETAALEKQIASVQSKIARLRAREGQLWLVPDRNASSKEPILAIVSGGDIKIERFNHPDQTQQFEKSRAHNAFDSSLAHFKPATQYIVFLIRPSGIGLFKDLVQVARERNFEVGFDALEEDREIHFTTPPPIEDEVAPPARPGAAAGPQPQATAPVLPGTNAPAEPAASTSTTSPTNSAPAPSAPQPPPPPKPKSWWQRLLEWLGIA